MATTTNFGWETPDDTDLVKDGALAMRTLGNAIDASMVDLKGGTTGQILSKTSNTDMDFTWITNDQGDITAVTAGTGISGGGTSGAVTITNSMATEITAAGDIIVGTGSGTFDNLPIGTTGQVLTADTTVSPYKVKWANAAGGGKVLQVVQTTKTDTFSTNSTSYVDITGFSASITPSSTSSKVLVLVNCGIIGCSNDWAIQLQILRGSTAIFSNTSGGSSDTNDAWHASGALSPANNRIVAGAHMSYLDSPSSTSSLTYKIRMLSGDSGTTGYLNRWALNSDLGSVSSITLLEIGA
jgi:hypothetical protein